MTESTRPAADSSDKQRVVLIGWDAADWEHIDPLLDQGQLPNLERLINGGTMGNLATMQPILSPMLWNTIATGKLPDAHGIHGFMEPDEVNNGARPVTSVSRKVKAIWNILSQSGYRSNVVGWWASYPAEKIDGRVVTQSIKSAKRSDGTVDLPAGAVHPAELTEEVANNIFFPDEMLPDDFLPFIPDAADINQQEDKRLRMFAKVFCDCATIQAITTALMEKPDWDFTAVYYDAIDHFCHAFMEYYPPQMPVVSDEDFEMYQHVIPSVYRFHDMLLGRLWELAGEDALIVLCSDHGFQSGGGRPLLTSNEPAGPADWHREYGIVVMHGPGIKKDHRIYGANLIDITPTILSYLGLPLGEDMQGRPLVDAFEKQEVVETIESWENVPGDHGMHPPGTKLEAHDSNELTKQFVALGYVNDHGDDLDKARTSAQTEMDYNLSQVYIGSGRAENARELLENLLVQYPWEIRFVFKLAHCYFACGYYQQCLDLLEKAYPGDEWLPPHMRMFKARSLVELDRLDEAHQHFDFLRQRNPRSPDLHAQLGRIYHTQRQYDKSVAAFERAIELAPERATAYQGLSTVRLKRRENELAADAALTAVGLLHYLPRAHFNLGVALARLGDYERAAVAFENACHNHGSMLQGHRWLEHIYTRFLKDIEKAELHKQRCEQLRKNATALRKRSEESKHATFDLPDLPAHDERVATLNKERPMGQHKEPEESSGRTLTIVSGLPRSGTSLMMQMLAAAGLEAKTDGERVADTDNPEGYLEWEAVKNLAKEPELLDDPDLDTKAIKVISMLLPTLPKKHQYKIIFMTRPVEEVAASQMKMIERLQNGEPDPTSEDITKQLEQHRTAVLSWMKANDHVKAILVNFPNLVKNPEPYIEEITAFLGDELISNPQAMASVVRPELHRQKLNK